MAQKQPISLHGLRRASFCTRPVQNKKSRSSHFEAHMNPKMSRALKLSAGLPEYVSTRHRKNSLRHGASRCPRVAFQINFNAPNKSLPSLPEHTSATGWVLFTEACRTNCPNPVAQSLIPMPSPASSKEKAVLPPSPDQPASDSSATPSTASSRS